MGWKPWLGAVADARGAHFRVWAPKTPSLEVKVGDRAIPMRRGDDGYFTAHVEGVRPGARFFYRFPDGRERPDPASLLQPEGGHGPSEVVDLAAIAPRPPSPRVPLEKLIFPDILLATYSPQGTADVAPRLVP